MEEIGSKPPLLPPMLPPMDEEGREDGVPGLRGKLLLSGSCDNPDML
jgi:hypothetical protein